MEKSIRLAGPALAAAVVLLAGACGSSDDGGGDAQDDQPDTEQSDPGDQDGGDGSDDSDGSGADSGLDSAYAGVWASDTGEGLLRLGEDRIATLVLESGMCVGAASEAAGQTMITVQCEEPAEYSVGRAEVDGQSLTVAWEGAGERAYTWVADVEVDLGDLNLDDLDLDLEGFDPGELDLDGIDLGEIEDLLPPGGSVDLGSD